MLKIVRPICCGTDVRKKFITVTIVATDSKGVTTYRTKEFKTFNYDSDNLKTWSTQNNCKNTSADSKYVKAIAGKKLIRRIHVIQQTYSNMI